MAADFQEGCTPEMVFLLFFFLRLWLNVYYLDQRRAILCWSTLCVISRQTGQVDGIDITICMGTFDLCVYLKPHSEIRDDIQGTWRHACSKDGETSF